jgi:nitrogen regulatory protein PII-like uncharacterized protein
MALGEKEITKIICTTNALTGLHEFWVVEFRDPTPQRWKHPSSDENKFKNANLSHL